MPVDISAATVVVSHGVVNMAGITNPAGDEMIIPFSTPASHNVGTAFGFCFTITLGNIKCNNPGPAQPSGILDGVVRKIKVLYGNGNNDNFCNANDYTAVKSVLGKSIYTPGFRPDCDFQLDGFNNANDYTEIKKNLGKSVVGSCP